MSFLKKLFGKQAPEWPPEQYMTPWEAVEGFVGNPHWGVEVLRQEVNEEQNWIEFRYDHVVGEIFEDPEGEWLHLRFRHEFTAEQRSSELERYKGWSEHCALHTLFRWDIDEERQEYYGDVFIPFLEQNDHIDCIRSAFNSAKLLREKENRISLARREELLINGRKYPSVAIALWYWFDSPLAPAGTKMKLSHYREKWYDCGSAVCSVMQEQWLYYARIAFSAPDYQLYMPDPERRLMLYKMHLGIQRRYPRIRNFILWVGNGKDNDGVHETSTAILVSRGTEASPIFERMFRELYEHVIDYTEWFNFDFNKDTAPWFDHSVKKPQRGYKRTSAPRGMPDLDPSRGTH